MFSAEIGSVSHGEEPFEQVVAMSGGLDFYAAAGAMTDLDGLEDALVGVSADASEIAAVVQGLVVHPFWAEAYGVDSISDRDDELQIRSAAKMVKKILSIDDRPIANSRNPQDRILGNCRHFSVLSVALFRRAGVPARARCGFSSYFELGKWVDHWIVEYWEGGRWISLDPQLDALQSEAIGFADNPLDLSSGLFLTAGDAWLRCQAGTEDGDNFGILDEWGQWFIKGNIARDLAALNKIEMLPWDGWGSLAHDGRVPGGDSYIDTVAALTNSNDFESIRSRYEQDDGLRVPPRVTAFYTANGPVEVDIPELA